MKLNFVNGENDKLMSDDNGIKKFTIKMTENKAILRKKCLFGISNLEFFRPSREGEKLLSIFQA